eukprot:2259893-Pyramimonas_sp.AAC.1
MEMENMAQYLDIDERDDDASQVRAVAAKFLLRALRPAHTVEEIGEDRCRELRALCECADLIVKGRP